MGAPPRSPLAVGAPGAQKTQRTPIDLKDKWRVLSRKLPPGAAQAVDLASDPGPAQPSNRPVAYSREHLQLLPQPELVNLVLMWQSFHRMLRLRVLHCTNE